jgi:hypothetical protein
MVEMPALHAGDSGSTPGAGFCGDIRTDTTNKVKHNFSKNNIQTLLFETKYM